MESDVRDLRTLIRLAREEGDGRIAIPLDAAERIADRLENPVTITIAERAEPVSYKCQRCGMYPVRGPLENFCRVCVPRLGDV